MQEFLCKAVVVFGEPKCVCVECVAQVVLTRAVCGCVHKSLLLMVFMQIYHIDNLVCKCFEEKCKGQTFNFDLYISVLMPPFCVYVLLIILNM